MATTHILNQLPHVALVTGAVPQDMLTSLLGETDFTKSLGFQFDSKDSALVEHRTSSTCFVRSKYDNLTKLVLKSLETDLTVFHNFECCETWQIARYEPNQYYRPHWDYFNVAGYENTTDNDRIATVILYLNDDFTGGATNFTKLNLSVAPVAGNYLYFTYPPGELANLTMHEGAPVDAGVKYIATLWIRFNSWS